MRAVRGVIAAVPGELSMPSNWHRAAIWLLVGAALMVQLLFAFDELNQRSIGPGTGMEELTLDLSIKRVNSAAEQSGVQVGDRVVKLNGVPVSTPYHYRRLLNELPLGSEATVVVERGGTEFELGPVRVVRDNVQGLLLVTRQLAGLTCAAIAAWVGLARPGARAAQLFFLAALGLGTYFVLMGTRNDGLVYVQIVTLTLTSGLALHFFLTFPREWTPVVRKWWPLLYLPSMVLLGLTVAAFRDAVQAGLGIYGPSDYGLLHNRVDFGLLALSGVVGLVAVVRGYVTASSSVERRQLQWIIWGLGIASLAAIADMALTALKSQTPELSVVLTLGVLPLPLSFAFAILRYRLWDIDLVLNRSALYGVLTAALAAVYLLLINVLSAALGVTRVDWGSAAVLFGAALVIGILVNPLRSRIQALIDRLFFRSSVDHQQMLSRWSAELSTSLRFVDLAALLLAEVPRVLQLKRAWLLVLNHDETAYQPMVDTEAASEEPLPTGLALSTHSSLAAHLGRREEVVLLYDRPNSATQQGEVLGEWHALGVRVCLPLVNGGKLVGIYLLGDKLSGDFYQRKDLDLLRTLANQAAVAISNARLYEQVHAFSQEMETKVRERTKELRDFVSVVYHELSTPITAVRGYTDVLLDGVPGPLTDKQARYLEAVKRSSLRLTGLVTDLSDVSKLDGGRLRVHTEAMDLEEAVTETLAALSPVIEEKGLQVTTHLASDATWVIGDCRRVVQILTNLVGNACRYTPEGGHVDVRAQRDNGSTEVTVTDTGIGIHQEDLGAIFDRFYRSSDPLVQGQPGTGLGLAITRSLVELHGSKLWVTSTAGKGSTFGFALHAAEAVDEY